MPPNDDLYVQMSLRVARIALDSIPSAAHDGDDHEPVEAPAETEQPAAS